MKRIKVFALVEGRIIDNLSDRVSGTWIRIHYILKYLKQKEDIQLIYIPFEYKQTYSQGYSRINWFIDLFYHFAIPFLSLLIIVFRRPHFVYFSYPNVVHNDTFNVFILRFARKMGVRLLMYSHDWVEQSEIDGRGKAKFLSEELERELVQTSDILVVVASKYPEHETSILPGGLEEVEFVNLSYKIHKDRFNIAYTGSMSQSKGIDVLVDSTIMLHRNYTHIKLLLFGRIHTLDKETRKKIEESEFIVQTVIPRTKLINYFSEVDVFAYTYNPNIPYWNHTRSAKFFEYIGSGIPFIATKCAGLKMITDGEGLLWVDYSAEDFVEKLEYLLKNPLERMRLSAELHQLKSGNTWEKRADTLHDIILNNQTKWIRARM